MDDEVERDEEEDEEEEEDVGTGCDLLPPKACRDDAEGTVSEDRGLNKSNDSLASSLTSNRVKREPARSECGKSSFSAVIASSASSQASL